MEVLCLCHINLLLIGDVALGDDVDVRQLQLQHARQR